MSRGARKPVARDSDYVPEIELSLHEKVDLGTIVKVLQTY